VAPLASSSPISLRADRRGLGTAQVETPKRGKSQNWSTSQPTRIAIIASVEATTSV
jgi:hypothetical protein